MNKVTIILIILMVCVGGYFAMNMQAKMAQERCAMQGGRWSEAERSCSN